MIVRCNVGGCEWAHEHPLKTQLDLHIEQHRAARHPWVKPGRLGNIELDALELIQKETHATNTP